MCVLLGWHESLASSQSMKYQCQQQSERSPDWKGETKACNFSLPDILAIIILSHLLKTKWFLSCRKGQNVVVSVPSEEVISFPERWETAWGRWPRLAPSQGLGLGHADDLCHSLLVRLIWILQREAQQQLKSSAKATRNSGLSLLISKGKYTNTVYTHGLQCNSTRKEETINFILRKWFQVWSGTLWQNSRVETVSHFLNTCAVLYTLKD